MTIKLTTEQRDRLKAAASGVYGDLREKLSEKQIDDTGKRINEVLYELHNESPEAFSTFCYKNQLGTVMFSKLKNY